MEETSITGVELFFGIFDATKFLQIEEVFNRLNLSAGIKRMKEE